ncbi:MAG: hypothetical protein PUD59_04540 [bacterium]|nr:hypothetical protein [bacterium]
MLDIINFSLIKDVLVMGFINSLIITNLVQKIKENLNIKCSSHCVIVSLIVSFLIGTLFSLTFSNLNFICCIWSSLFSFIGADILYKILENKIFTSLSNIKKTVEK